LIVDTLLAKVFGTQNERELKKLTPAVARINELEPSIQALSDEDLRARTPQLRERVAAGESLDDLLPEAFAIVREAARRALQMRHYDVQLIGGMALHHGKIAEMKTGEGKTLVATLPAYLNALEGQGVHIITVNDYLARRDSEWMGRIYRFLGMTVGVIQHELNDADRKAAYASDITYGTNNEFGFDYLRDNMKFDLASMVQRGHRFAIVDEVDSILIDEARTPLIISGPAEESTDLYYEVDRIIPRLKKGAVIQGNVKAEEREALEQTGDYIIDEKHKTSSLTESGMAKCEEMLAQRLHAGGLYDPANMPLLHHINQALRAHTLFRRDTDYVVNENGEVIIVDEFTGRLMPGRRWSDGLHQAVEAKEHVKIERENQTLATITLQNYFRKYAKLAGMTGTAETEAEEFGKIYKLDVVVIPTNRPLIRLEEPDLVFRTEEEKWESIVAEIIEKYETGRPVLVGTVSIAKSERIAGLLHRRGTKHVVLNAKFHAKEAEIVAQAGRKGVVTIATNMAGRGTDILLGGNAEFLARQACLREQTAERLAKGQERFVDDEQFVYFYHIDGFFRVPAPVYRRHLEAFKAQCDAEHDEVVAVGGLHIIGTERHEARRIDNQLRGRAGRQGDPGSSRFYLSLQDDLMRIFGSANVSGLMQRLGMEEGVPIESRMVTKAIARAQKQVEAQNFSIRKHLLEYDDVMNKQRENVYALRRQILEGKIRLEDAEVGIREYLRVLGEEALDSCIDTYCGADTDPADWDVGKLREEITQIFGLEAADLDGIAFEQQSDEELSDALWTVVSKKYDTKELTVGRELLALPEDLALRIVDRATLDRLSTLQGDERDPAAGRAILEPIERSLALQIVDQQWKDHLYSLDHLKEGIGLRGYGQRDPLVEYKKESFALFQAMKERIDDETIRYLWRLRPVLSMGPEMPTRRQTARRPAAALEARHEAAPAFVGGGQPAASGGRPRPARTGGDDVVRTVRRDMPKVGRNDPCPCGSGKKYKKCHGAA
jgi:preprotein translocase subunit SecA